jgi:hypothetical protein
MQDLKDFGREAGSVSFADIDRDFPGQGYVILFLSKDAVRNDMAIVFLSILFAMMQNALLRSSMAETFAVTLFTFR